MKRGARPVVAFRVLQRTKRELDRLAVQVLLRRPSLSLEEARGVVVGRASRALLRAERRRR